MPQNTELLPTELNGQELTAQSIPNQVACNPAEPVSQAQGTKISNKEVRLAVVQGYTGINIRCDDGEYIVNVEAGQAVAASRHRYLPGHRR